MCKLNTHEYIYTQILTHIIYIYIMYESMMNYYRNIKLSLEMYVGKRICYAICLATIRKILRIMKKEILVKLGSVILFNEST